MIYNLKGLNDCNNVILLSSLNLKKYNKSWCINLCNNRLCNFLISTILLVYNLINYHNIDSNCINYFEKEAVVVCKIL